MTYLKTVWADDETSLGPTNLNKMETQYDEAKAELAKAGTSDITVDDRNITNNGRFMLNTKAYGVATYTDNMATGTTLTKRISIGTGKQHGKAIIRPSAATSFGIMVNFGTDNTKTLVVGTGNSGYPNAWSRDFLGSVTGAVFGFAAVGNDYARVNEIYIDSATDELVVVFHNPDASTRALACRVDWEVL